MRKIYHFTLRECGHETHPIEGCLHVPEIEDPFARKLYPFSNMEEPTQITQFRDISHVRSYVNGMGQAISMLTGKFPSIELKMPDEMIQKYGTKFWAVMIDETGCEFGVGVTALDHASARDWLAEMYPESWVDQLESPEETAARERETYRRAMREYEGEWEFELEED